MKKLIYFILAMTPIFALASGSENGGHGEGIPETVKYQAINIIILIAGIIYFAKGAVVSFFTSRQAEYVQAAQKSAKARQEAESNLTEVKTKLQDLVGKQDETITLAHSQAEETKKQLMAEAEQISKRIKDEAALTAKLEIQKAEKALREQLIHDSFEIARNVLAKDISTQDHASLQSSFSKNIEGAAK